MTIEEFNLGIGTFQEVFMSMVDRHAEEVKEHQTTKGKFIDDFYKELNQKFHEMVIGLGFRQTDKPTIYRSDDGHYIMGDCCHNYEMGWFIGRAALFDEKPFSIHHVCSGLRDPMIYDFNFKYETEEQLRDQLEACSQAFARTMGIHPGCVACSECWVPY